eukprot:gene34463-44530_t
MEIVVEYFSRFNSLLNSHATDITSVRRTVRLIDLVMEKDLFDFLCWLLSDNERELYFSRNCAIKFIHCQAKNELLKGSSASSVSSVSSCSSSHSLKSTCTLTAAELESARETVSVPLSPQSSPPSSPPRIQERVTETQDNALVGSASASASGTKEEPEMLLSYLLDTYRVERMIQQLQQRVGGVWKDSRSSSAPAPDEEGEEGEGDARSCASSKLTESCDESVSSSASRHGDGNGDDHGDLAAGSSDDLSLSSSASAQSTDSDRDDRAAAPHSPSSPAPVPASSASASASSLLKLLTLLRQEQTTVVLCGDNGSDIDSQSGEIPAPPSGESAARTGDALSHSATGSTDCSELSMTTIYSLGPDSVATADSDESVLRTNPLLADRRSHRSAAHTPECGRPCALSNKSEADPALLDSPSGAARPVAVAAPIPPPAPSPVPLLRCGRAGSSKESPSTNTGRPGSAALQADRSAAGVRAGRKAASTTAGPPPSPSPSCSSSSSSLRSSAASKRSASNSSKVVAKAAVTVPVKVQSRPSAGSAPPTPGDTAGKLRASRVR